MDEKKQIEEMAKIITKNSYLCKGDYIRTTGKHNRDHCEDCDLRKACLSYDSASEVYNAGYRKQSEWISVEERLPDIELHKAKAVVPDVLFPCLVVREGNIVSYVEKAWYWGAKFTTQDCTDITDSITHWMPLPEAPKMKGGAE